MTLCHPVPSHCHALPSPSGSLNFDIRAEIYRQYLKNLLKDLSEMCIQQAKIYETPLTFTVYRHMHPNLETTCLNLSQQNLKCESARK